MRKITLLLALMAFVGFSFAQNCSKLSKENINNIEKANYQQQLKAAFDVIWSEDFNETKWKSSVGTEGKGYKLIGDGDNLPGGWTVKDNTDKKFYWHWSDVGPRGKYTGKPTFDDPAEWTLKYLPGTTDNGFMMLESDWFNTTDDGNMVYPVKPIDSYIQFGPIDFSNHPYVIFNIKTLFRNCCWGGDNYAVEFSTNYNPADGSGDWKAYSLNIITASNNTTVVKERDQHINVSSIVGGKSSVYFRIHRIPYKTTNSGHYFWMIDDIKFYVAPDNDMRLNDTWFDYIYDATDLNYHVADYATANFWGGYSQIPNNVVGPFVQFRGAVFNNGANEAENVTMTAKIYKDGEEVKTVASTPKNIAAIVEDTLAMAVNYIPTEVGNYQVSMTVAMNAADQISSDNGWGYDFSVVLDTVYSRVRHGHEADFDGAGPSDWSAGGNDGDMCAQRYAFPVSVRTVTVKGINVYITNQDKSEKVITAIKNGSISIIGHIYKVDTDPAQPIDAGIKTNTYTVSISDTATWVYLPFKDEGNLDLPVEDRKQYHAVIEFYTGGDSENNRIRFCIGEDKGNPTKQPKLGGTWYSVKNKKWWWASANYAIDLVIDNPNILGAVNETRALNNVKIYPNPFNNIVTVANLSNSKNIIISNVLGQTVMNVPVTTSKVEINTADLDKGVYLITIVDNNGNTRTEKLVKK